jgi:hypothetical protein
MPKVNTREAWRRLEESQNDTIQQGIDEYQPKKVKNNSRQANKQALQKPQLENNSARETITGS